MPDENAIKGRVPLLRGTTKSATTSVVVAGPSKPTTTTLDPNLQHKRKREALGEVTNNNKNKNPPKGTSKDGKTVKPHVLITTKPARPTIKAPARRARTTSVAAASEAENQEDQPQDGGEDEEDAMIVDEPVAEPAPALHRVTRLTKRTSTIAPSAPAAHRLTSSNGDVVKGHSRTGTTDAEKGKVEDDTHRAFKRRRTSSEADVEAVVETQAEIDASPVEDGAVSEQKREAHAPVSQMHEEGEDEELTGWDDLDKDDFDDPYMVSEYVVDIFKYLSECEVSKLLVLIETSVKPRIPRPRRSPTPTTCSTKQN